jgi:NAD(P)H-hydrate epimerase
MLTSAAAAALDAALLTTTTLEVLTELAGEAVALAVSASFPPATHPRIICACGPGNNGADGLVAARHLVALGYGVRVVAPARPAAARADTEAARVWVRHHAALSAWDIDVLDGARLPDDADVYVDAVLGFSATGAPRAPLDALIAALAARGDRVVSVDVPSGWLVDGGAAGAGLPASALRPAVLVSLTAPKPCAAAHEGTHWLGLMAVPPRVARDFGLDSALWRGARAPVVRLA